MDAQARSKAEQYARNKYAAAVEKFSRKLEDDIATSRREIIAARKMAIGGAVWAVTARHHANFITSLVQAKVDALLDGYDLYFVTINDEFEVVRVLHGAQRWP